MYVVIIGYKRREVGEIGGAFDRVAVVQSSGPNVANDIMAILVALEASSNIVIQRHKNGEVICLTPEQDEGAHFFASAPFRISVKPVFGVPRFETSEEYVVVRLSETGAVVAAMVVGLPVPAITQVRSK